MREDIARRAVDAADTAEPKIRRETGRTSGHMLEGERCDIGMTVTIHRLGRAAAADGPGIAPAQSTPTEH